MMKDLTKDKTGQTVAEHPKNLTYRLLRSRRVQMM